MDATQQQIIEDRVIAKFEQLKANDRAKTAEQRAAAQDELSQARIAVRDATCALNAAMDRLAELLRE